MKTSLIGRALPALAWRVQRLAKVVTDVQEWLSRPWLSARVRKAVCVRPAVAESYPPFPLGVRWSRTGGGFEPRYVYELADAEVAVSSGLVSLDGWTLAESVGDHLCAATHGLVWRGLRRLARLTGRVQRLDGGASCTYLKDDGYFHFVMESLVRLCHALKACPGSVVLVDPTPANGFYGEYVELLRQRGLVTRTREVTAPVVSAASYVMTAAEQDSGMFCRPTVELLREVFLAGLPEVAPTRRIFLTRRKRRFENQDALEDIARASGLEVVDTEGMPVSGQIDLFRASALVVANHGAGLANLVYAGGRATVVELFSTKWLNDCYFRLAAVRGMGYRCLVADESGDWGRIDETAFREAIGA